MSRNSFLYHDLIMQNTMIVPYYLFNISFSTLLCSVGHMNTGDISNLIWPKLNASGETLCVLHVDFASERSRNGVQVALAVPTLTLMGYGYMYIRISPSVYTCPLIVGFPQVTYFSYCFARDFEKYSEKKLIRPARPGPTGAVLQ